MHGLPDAKVTVMGQGGAHPTVWLGADPDAVTTFRIFVKVPAQRLDGKSTPFAFVIRENAVNQQGDSERHTSVFRSPEK